MKYGALLQNTYIYTYKCKDGLRDENVPDRSDLFAGNIQTKLSRIDIRSKIVSRCVFAYLG